MGHNIFELKRKLEALNTDEVINASIDATLNDLENINRERMMDGVRSDGSIMPNYSNVSVSVYGYPEGPIKLKATGAFQAAITATRNGDVITETSTDEKTKMLVGRYGPEIFGTGTSYRTQYIKDNLRPAFNSRIKAAVKL